MPASSKTWKQRLSRALPAKSLSTTAATTAPLDLSPITSTSSTSDSISPPTAGLDFQLKRPHSACSSSSCRCHHHGDTFPTSPTHQRQSSIKSLRPSSTRLLSMIQEVFPSPSHELAPLSTSSTASSPTWPASTPTSPRQSLYLPSSQRGTGSTFMDEEFGGPEDYFRGRARGRSSLDGALQRRGTFRGLSPRKPMVEAGLEVTQSLEEALLSGPRV